MLSQGPAGHFDSPCMGTTLGFGIKGTKGRITGCSLLQETHCTLACTPES